MQKMVVLLRRNEGMSKQEFEQWWLGGHAEIVRRFPGLVRYTINIFEGPLPNSEGTDWDGIAELWYTDRAAVDRAYESPIAREGMADTAAHLSGVARMVTTEHEIAVISEADSKRLPSSEWFRERIASQAVRDALIAAGGHLDASVGLHVAGNEPIWLRVRGAVATISTVDETAAEAHYTVRGPDSAWHQLLSGDVQFPEAVSTFGGLALSGELVKSAGDMWALTRFFAACSEAA